MSDTYIRVLVKGKLTDVELRGLAKALQNVADDMIATIQADFGRITEEEGTYERTNGTA